MASLTSSMHGKSRVRVMRVHRRPDGIHDVRELTVSVMLEGAGFARAFTDADNRETVATDTIRNIVHVVAREQVAADGERFADALARRLLALYPGVRRVTIEARARPWSRVRVAGALHPHAFAGDANGTPLVRTIGTREAVETRSGVEHFEFLKTTGSGWAGFLRDRYTTLPETDDRIAATAMCAEWGWRTVPDDPDATRTTLLDAMLAVFATTWSASLQDSLWRMASAALEAVPDIADLRLACPNRHYIVANLAPFGLDNPNAVFVATDEPHGQIECTVAR